MTSHHQRLPQQIDPFRLAHTGQRLSGSIPLKQLSRLTPLLTDSQGEVEVVLEFSIDPAGTAVLNGRIRTVLHLRCQRCTENMTWPVASEFCLGLLTSEASLEGLPEQYEPYVVEAVPVYLQDIIEDELLLVFPQIPKHNLDECPARSYLATESDAHQVSKGDTHQPFAGLSDLFKND
ncbi:MAG: YceD family protein [Gammaproteobacteria bacterium]